MVKPEKILILSNICIGGVETFSIYIAKALKKEGYNVYFINQNEIKNSNERFSNSLELALVNDNIPIITVEESLTKKYFSTTSKFIIPFYATKYLELFYKQVVKSNVLPILYGYIHNDGAYYYDNAFLYESITSKFICVSESIKLNLHKILNENDKLIYQKCPLLIKCSKKEVSSEKKDVNLLFVGRINDNPKGVFKLVMVAKYLEKNNISFKMNIVGDGVDINQLKDSFKKNKISSEINFITNADTPEKVIPFYETADILLILSSFEGGPLVLYEAMEFGVIPIGFNVGVMTELIDNGISGYVFEQSEFDLLLEQIKFLSKNNNLITIKKNAQSKIRSLNIGIDSYTKFMKQLLENPKNQYLDVSIRKTNSKLKWKKKDLKSWISKVIDDDILKRNNIIHYLTFVQHNRHLKTIEIQKHYQRVYEDMPLWWKKIGALIRKLK